MHCSTPCHQPRDMTHADVHCLCRIQVRTIRSTQAIGGLEDADDEKAEHVEHIVHNWDVHLQSHRLVQG